MRFAISSNIWSPASLPNPLLICLKCVRRLIRKQDGNELKHVGLCVEQQQKGVERFVSVVDVFQEYAGDVLNRTTKRYPG